MNRQKAVRDSHRRQDCRSNEHFLNPPEPLTVILRNLFTPFPDLQWQGGNCRIGKCQLTSTSTQPQEDCMKIGCSSPSGRMARNCFAAAFSGLILIAACTLQAERLPSTVRPEHYTLTLTPDLKAATFTGFESIDVNLAEPATSISLNAAEITFQSVTMTAGGRVQG